MDTIRTKKSNRRSWLIAGSLIVVLLIVFVVICVALFGGDSSEKTVDDTSETIKTVPEAFDYIEKSVETTLTSKDEEKPEVLEELKVTKDRIVSALDHKKESEKHHETSIKDHEIKPTVKSDKKIEHLHSLPPHGSHKEMKLVKREYSSVQNPEVIVKVTGTKTMVKEPLKNEDVSEVQQEHESTHEHDGEQGFIFQDPKSHPPTDKVVESGDESVDRRSLRAVTEPTVVPTRSPVITLTPTETTTTPTDTIDVYK